MAVITITKTHYINLIDGRFFIDDHRYEGTDIVALDVIRTANIDFKDIQLSATFTQYLVYNPELRFATFSGILRGFGNTFLMCHGDMASNINSIEDAMMLWGLDENLKPAL